MNSQEQLIDVAPKPPKQLTQLEVDRLITTRLRRARERDRQTIERLRRTVRARDRTISVLEASIEALTGRAPVRPNTTEVQEKDL